MDIVSDTGSGIAEEEQADLLEREGVTMKDAWHVDLKKHQWKV